MDSTSIAQSLSSVMVKVYFSLKLSVSTLTLQTSHSKAKAILPCFNKAAISDKTQEDGGKGWKPGMNRVKMSTFIQLGGC